MNFLKYFTRKYIILTGISFQWADTGPSTPLVFLCVACPGVFNRMPNRLALGIDCDETIMFQLVAVRQAKYHG